MLWGILIVLTVGALAHLDETIPADAPAITLDTDVLNTEWVERYGTEPPDCWLVMVGEKPMPCEDPELPTVKKGPPVDA